LLVALPELPIAVLLGGGLVTLGLVVWQPLAGIALLLFAVPFGSLTRASSSESTKLSFGAAEVLVALVALAWLAQGVRRRHVRVRASALVAAIGAMAALALFSISYAADKSAAIKESLKWLELLLVYLVVVDLVRDRVAAAWLVAALLVAGVAEASVGAFQFATGSGPSTFEVEGSLRAFGNFEQPNPFAGYLTTGLPIAALMAACRANSTRFRLLAVAASAALGAGVGLSQSRGAWLGAAVMAISLAIVWSATTRRWLAPLGLAALGSLALAFLGVLPPSILDRVSQAVEYFGVFDVRGVEITSENFAVLERMAHWQAGWYMFLDHPWLGVGAGNYPAAYPDYYVASWIEALGHAHNYYLNTLAELGLIGGGVLLVVLSLAFRQLGHAVRRSGQTPALFWRAVLAGVVGALIVFCVHSLFDNLFVHSVNIQIGVLLGLGTVAVERL
jgi:O-antigen ligase